MEGIGGESVEFLTHNISDNEKAFKIKYYPNQTNAYMLIYIREEEYDQILADENHREIPINLYNRFKLEEIKRNIIHSDHKMVTGFSECYIICSDTMMLNDWKGLKLA